MSVMAKQMPLLLKTCCPARRHCHRPAEGEPQTLAQRYQAAGQHGRLCLWLQFREARPQLDQLEAACPAPPARRRGWLARLLGMPSLGL
ncbi:MAG: hypothetical protein HY910_16480 [Desulfarculus sp.]|nr:hypothetical protein [Desulfarculus sp.]